MIQRRRSERTAEISLPTTDSPRTTRCLAPKR
jgi:hypothetical protein